MPKTTKKDRPVILITNDDGVMAPGILNLVEAVKDLGKVVVVAPDKPQSGMGHAITIGLPLRLHRWNYSKAWKPGNVREPPWIALSLLWIRFSGGSRTSVSAASIMEPTIPST